MKSNSFVSKLIAGIALVAISSFIDISGMEYRAQNAPIIIRPDSINSNTDRRDYPSKDPWQQKNLGRIFQPRSQTH